MILAAWAGPVPIIRKAAAARASFLVMAASSMGKGGKLDVVFVARPFAFVKTARNSQFWKISAEGTSAHFAFVIRFHSLRRMACVASIISAVCFRRFGGAG